MKKIFLICYLSLSLCSFNHLLAQNKSTKTSTNTISKKSKEICLKPDKLPEFIGGELALKQYIKESLIVPEIVYSESIYDTVLVGFIVEKDGSLTEIKTIKSVNSNCDDEAIRLVKDMSKWKPGIKNNQVVRTYYKIPIVFNESDYQFNQIPFMHDIDNGPGDEITAVPSEEVVNGQPDTNKIYTFVVLTADFPGGDSARIKFIAQNIKYPEVAKEGGIQGIVYVTFVVKKDGTISNPQVLRGIGGGCDEEAIRVIKLMPKLIPAKQNGEVVNSQYNMPIKFTLTNSK